ncbi:hypothetical protein NIES4071_10850 [Calothrix sp. NIES-4071]|nr:hypothetical protein NIES4071_10850 [Calothrix sp. NIES-4071]BAZ55426.1 hypothetical protein NIES4105_10810 [Calothrix sp. NIES-4105]
MRTVSREELIKESKEIVELNILKEKLENVFDNEYSSLIKSQEKYNDLLTLLDVIVKSENPKLITSRLYEVAEAIKDLANKHSHLISEEIYESLMSVSDRLELWGDVCTSMFKIDKSLTEKSSIATLKKWADWIELLVEAINSDKGKISLDNLNNLEELAQAIVEVTFITNRKEIAKNRYKRTLNNSANFILSIIEQNKSNKPWSLTYTGKNSYQKLLKKSQERIHLLDNLNPKNDEEAKKQSDTLDYLEKYLNRK